MSGKPKKNISVEFLINEVNRINRFSTVEPEVRQGWNTLLETILFKTDNYAGFGYLTEKELPKGVLPGIIFTPDEQPTYPDETRKVFFFKKS